MAYTLFSGCSYTYGSGFSLEKDDPSLWVNLLHSQNQYLSKTQLLNVSEGGRSNDGIFQDTVYNLSKYTVQYALVEWTSMPRYRVSLGLELYETKVDFMPNCSTRDVNLNKINYTSSYLDSIRDRFTSLADYHHEICKVITFTNALINLCKLTSTRIFFINGICPWDKDYFVKLYDVLPSGYTEFTKKLLNVDSRDDDEIFKLYDKIHHEYDSIGGVQQDHWLNLYQSMRSQQIDVNNDNQHPGVVSNQTYCNKFNQILNSKLQAV
jgi:hypothetical protein